MKTLSKKPELTEEVLAELVDLFEHIETTIWKRKIRGKTQRAQTLETAREACLPYLNRAGAMLTGTLETMRGER